MEGKKICAVSLINVGILNSRKCVRFFFAYSPPYHMLLNDSNWGLIRIYHQIPISNVWIDCSTVRISFRKSFTWIRYVQYWRRFNFFYGSFLMSVSLLYREKGIRLGRVWAWDTFAVPLCDHLCILEICHLHILVWDVTNGIDWMYKFLLYPTTNTFTFTWFTYGCMW